MFQATCKQVIPFFKQQNIQSNYGEECPGVHASAPGVIVGSKAFHPRPAILADVRPVGFGRNRFKYSPDILWGEVDLSST
jgi:hypothetical protein